MVLQKYRSVALLAMAFTFVMAFAMSAFTGTVSAATGNNTTDANTTYLGLTMLEWALVAIIFVLLGLFAWLKNIYIFFGFIALVVVEMIVHFFG